MVRQVREVMIVAGEASGDLHAAALASELGALRPDLTLIGMGGGRMERAGVQLLERTDGRAVMGFVEVIREVPRHFALLRALRSRLQGGKVAALVTIDYPGFNMRLAASARAAGVPVIYYITPQVWAWGAGRLPKLATLITKAAVILPFEEALLRAHGIDATFVGHPLLDRTADMPDRDAARTAVGLPADAPVLALFPGSRQQEIDRHLDDFVATAAPGRGTNLKVIVSTAPGVSIPPTRCPFPQVRVVAHRPARLMPPSAKWNDHPPGSRGWLSVSCCVSDQPLDARHRRPARSHSAHRIGERRCREGDRA